MILNRLKESTATFHQLSEELNFSKDILNSSITKADYLLLLKRLHALFTQVALFQEVHGPENTITAFFFENKARLVYEDIAVLENDFTRRTFPFRQIAYFEYLGFCYVALGSMLGGQFIYRNIANPIDKNNIMPGGFYASCKDAVSLRWKPFTDYLQTIPDADQEPVINGAVTAYLYFIYLCTVIK